VTIADKQGHAVLGVDPGTRKVGWALAEDAQSAAIALGIEPIESLMQRLNPLLGSHPIRAVALGAGTNAEALASLLEPLRVPVHLIDERDTTYRARELYFADNPPRGWRKWVPLSLQTPPRPIDDYAALLIARRHIALGG
jgi:RNase H-fold protein (predicted Holliday junction resolvase)